MSQSGKEREEEAVAEHLWQDADAGPAHRSPDGAPATPLIIEASLLEGFMRGDAGSQACALTTPQHPWRGSRLAVSSLKPRIPNRAGEPLRLPLQPQRIYLHRGHIVFHCLTVYISKCWQIKNTSEAMSHPNCLTVLRTLEKKCDCAALYWHSQVKTGADFKSICTKTNFGPKKLQNMCCQSHSTIFQHPVEIILALTYTIWLNK